MNDKQYIKYVVPDDSLPKYIFSTIAFIISEFSNKIYELNSANIFCFYTVSIYCGVILTSFVFWLEYVVCNDAVELFGATEGILFILYLYMLKYERKRIYYAWDWLDTIF